MTQGTGPGAATQLKRLVTITEAALAHLELDELLEELLTRLRDMLTVDTVAIHLLEADRNELVARAARGLEEEVERGLRIPVGRGFAGRIAAERRPIAIEDLEHADILNPLLRAKGIQSLLGVPLMVEGQVIGVLHVGSLTERTFSPEETQLLAAAADRMALGIAHARLFEAEREARVAAERSAEQIRQLQAITDVTLMHLSLDDALLGEVLTRVRDSLGVDTAAILLHDEGRGELVARAARGLEEAVERGVRIPVGGGFAGRVAAERAPVVIEDTRYAELLNPILKEKGVRSLLGVPLHVQERLLGVLHVGSLQPRSFTDEDVKLLLLAADRIAIALDHARLYEREHRVAEVLQRSLLPQELPRVHGVKLAARYLPGSDESEVGGDWYDVIPLSGGALGLAMGDVVSRGVRAAAAMGRMRNALRAYALDGGSPGDVMGRLARLARTLDEREMATAAYAVFDPERYAVDIARAGHPPPLLVESDGSAGLLEGESSVPLGVATRGGYPEASHRLEPGSTLLLYTDGLVESRETWLAEGLDRLVRVASGAPAEPDALCDHVLAAMLDSERAQDDIALLAMRVDPVRDERLLLELPAERESSAVMRRALRGWLAGVGAAADESYDILVAVGEACANAIEHAYGPSDEAFTVQAEARPGGVVTIVVHDRGRWREARGRHRGRGRQLMAELMDDVKLSTSEDGTEVRLERRLAQR